METQTNRPTETAGEVLSRALPPETKTPPTAPPRASQSRLYEPQPSTGNYYREKAVEEAVKYAACPPRHWNATPIHSPEWLKLLAELDVARGRGFLIALAGPRGTGKTQLAVELIRTSIKDAIDEEGKGDVKSAAYRAAMDFFMALKGSYRKDSTKSEGDILAEYCRPGLLVLEEITVRSESLWENNLLVHLVTKRYDACKDTLLIGNFTPELAPQALGASICSRLQEVGGILHCNVPSFRAAKAAS